MLGFSVRKQTGKYGKRAQIHEWVKILLLILMILMPTSSTAAEGLQDESGVVPSEAGIWIKSPVEIGKQVISLGDIATFTGMPEDMVESLSGMEVGKAPPPGQTRTLSLAIVRVRLRQAGHDPDSVKISGPVTIMVSTRSAVVTGDEVTRAVEDYVKANMPWNPGEAKISVSQGQDRILVPDGDIEIQVEPLSTTKFLGTTSVRVKLFTDGEMCRTFHVRVRLDVAKEVVVAKRTIQRHETISREDLALEICDLSNVPSDVAFDPLLVVGMMAKHTIPAIRPITFGSIQCPPVIQRGDLVTLEAVSGGVIVVIPGEALESGALDDLIRVRNASSGTVVRARVIDSQRVRGI